MAIFSSVQQVNNYTIYRQSVHPTNHQFSSTGGNLQILSTGGNQHRHQCHWQVAVTIIIDSTDRLTILQTIFIDTETKLVTIVYTSGNRALIPLPLVAITIGTIQIGTIQNSFRAFKKHRFQVIPFLSTSVPD